MARRGMATRGIGKPKNLKATFGRLLSYMGKFKVECCIIVFMLIITCLSNIGATIVLEPMINILDPTMQSAGEFQWLVDIFAKNGTLVEQFFALLIIMIAIYLLGVVATVVTNVLTIRVSANVLRQIRLDLFDKMEELPISYFDKRTHGEIMSTFTNDTDLIRDIITNGLPSMIQSSVLIVGFVVAMLINNWMLTLICMVQLLVNLLLVKIVGGRSHKYFAQQQKALAKVDGYVEEIVSGQKVVKVFTHEDEVKEEFEKKNNDLRKNAFKAGAFGNSFGPIINNVSHVFYAIIVAVGAIMVVIAKANQGTFTLFGVLSVTSVSVGSWIAFLEFSRRFSNPFSQLAQLVTGIMSALAGGERVFEVIDEKPEQDEGYVKLVYAKEDENGNLVESKQRTQRWAWKHPHSADGSVTYTELKGAVEFENVTFSYVEGKTVLKNVSLYAKPGQKIALVGSTGAGKTTITNLINRFYEIDEGKIRYDGINIQKIKKDDLRKSLAMVLQDTHLFTGTVMENIRYGRLDASDEECIQAAKTANADFFISHLPDGYQTMLVADGANLSQGQRQLISIARAAVADPPVLILDEATSSIDTRTEWLIEKGMDALMKGRTVFVIAHRLSTVRNSNAIMVMEKGEIIERGNHEQLLEQKGKYYQLYTGAFELD